MTKILFMPFLRMSSGHHQAADALMAYIQRLDSSIVCEKADILSYRFGNVESLVSGIYRNWIQWLPGSYSWIYKRSVCRNTETQSMRYLYEALFLQAMYRLIEETKPDAVFCTHALPSYLASALKRRGLMALPVINVYTDFFINDLWALHGIDYHLVPDEHIKRLLLSRGVQEDRIYITGIPVHPAITPSQTRSVRSGSDLTVLITGGSVGAGRMLDLIKKTKPAGRVRYKVLCGKNTRLYQSLMKLNVGEHIRPLPYIESRAEMNDLYDEADLIVTKPGGVTISECLRKNLPVLVYDALPGQEEMNLQHLTRLNLVMHWNGWSKGSIEDEIIHRFDRGGDVSAVKTTMNEYHHQLTDKDLDLTIQAMLNRIRGKSAAPSSNSLP